MDVVKLAAERDRYKVALEEIAAMTGGHQTLQRLEVARRALN